MVWIFQLLTWLLGLGAAVRRLVQAPTLQQQRAAWEAAWPVALLRRGPPWLARALSALASLLFFNRVMLWRAPLLDSLYK